MDIALLVLVVLSLVNSMIVGDHVEKIRYEANACVERARLANFECEAAANTCRESQRICMEGQEDAQTGSE